MDISFYKFDGAGNDFVVIDNRDGRFQATEAEVARICHRRFGVGADGLMTLENVVSSQWPVASGQMADAAAQTTDNRQLTTYDFEMKYYNSDGRLGSMCGNGGRCIAMFAYILKLPTTHYPLPTQYHFKGYDGPHDAEIVMWDEERRLGIVKLGMRSIQASGVRRCMDGWFLDTGSPHYVQRVNDLEHFDVVGEGRRIRNIVEEFPQGTNVDFIENLPDGRLMVRTYERGVEDETWACGTGVTACAIVTGNHRLVTRGGDFKVTFDATGEGYENVCLIGPVALNFTGEWTCSAR